MKEIYNLKEMSNYLNISDSLLRKLVRTNKIPYFRNGNKIFFKISSVNKWINKLEEGHSKNIFLFT